MYDPSVARNILVLAEIAAITIAVVSKEWDVGSDSAMAQVMQVLSAIATTVAVCIPLAFFYVFLGLGPEWSLATFPATLIAAPLLFFVLLARSRR